MKKLTLAVFFFAALSSCRSIKEVSNESGLLISPSDIKGSGLNLPGSYAVLKIYYATNRKLTSEKTTDKWLGNDRSFLKYGVCHVSIPRDHRMGKIERPSVWRFEIQEDTSKHVLLRKIVVEPKSEFFEDVKKRLKEKTKKDAFIFVHGYNTSFLDAAQTTAQLSYDLSFDGIPVFYSWPSKGTYLGYTADESTIEWAQIQLERFLTEFANRSGAENIHLIAHSMENRALLHALVSILESKTSISKRISEIVLAAPDIDVDVFRDGIAGRLINSKKHVTLYVSSTDKALVASKILHGGINRVGDANKVILVIPGIDTIDATDVNTNFIGHSSFSDSRSVISDIFEILKNHQKPDNRPSLNRRYINNHTYWEFKK